MLRTKRTQKTVDKGQRSHTWTAVFHAIASGWSPRGAARRAAAGESHPGIPFIPYSCASSSTRAFFNWALYLSCRQVEIGKIRAGPKKVERVDPAPPGQLPTRPSRHQPIAGPDTLIGKPQKRSAGRSGGRGALPVTPLFKTALPDPAIPNNASPASPPTRARRPREPLVVFKISQSALFSSFPRKNAHLQTRSIRTTVAGGGRRMLTFYSIRGHGAQPARLSLRHSIFLSALRNQHGQKRSGTGGPGGHGRACRGEPRAALAVGREESQAANFFSKNALLLPRKGRKRGQRREGITASSSSHLANFALWRVPA